MKWEEGGSIELSEGKSNMRFEMNYIIKPGAILCPDLKDMK